MMHLSVQVDLYSLLDANTHQTAAFNIIVARRLIIAPPMVFLYGN